MPDEDISVLPYRQLNAIYEEYKDDMNLIGETISSQSHFNATFNEVSTDLKIWLCRDTGAFVTCSVCDAYHTRLRAAKTPLERQQLKALRRKHLDKQRVQREKSCKHRLKAKLQPHKYLSIIIDGMDKKKLTCQLLGGL